MTDHEPELTADERRALATAWSALEPPADFADRVLAAPPTRRWLPYVAIASAAVAVALLAIVIVRPVEPDRPQVAPQAVDAGLAITAPPDAATLAPADAAVADADRYDLDLQIGQNAVIHAASGDARINFFTRACHAGLQVEIDRDPKFTAPTAAQGITGAIVELSTGAYHYRGTCMSGGMPEPTHVSGRIAVVRDRVDRTLPGAPLPVQLRADGRQYRVRFSDQLPEVTLEIPPGGERLHVTGPGVNRSFPVRAPQRAIVLPGATFGEGDYRLWFERGGVELGTIQVRFEFDNLAPQFTIESPSEPVFGVPRQTSVVDEVRVRGTVSTGWTAAFETISIPIGDRGRFEATVSPRRVLRSLAIRFSHPQRGTHYVLRRLR